MQPIERLTKGWRRLPRWGKVTVVSAGLAVIAAAGSVAYEFMTLEPSAPHSDR